MTDQEQRLLNAHNITFQVRADRAVINQNRFCIVYADGSRKWDYSCGSCAADLRRAAGI